MAEPNAIRADGLPLALTATVTLALTAPEARGLPHTPSGAAAARRVELVLYAAVGTGTGSIASPAEEREPQRL